MANTTLAAYYASSGSTFGGVKTMVTNRLGGFDAIAEKTIMVGNGKGKLNRGLKHTAGVRVSAAEEACELLNQKFQR
jgi:hypothetical protein